MKKLFALLVSLCLVFSCACASAATFGELQDMLRGGSTEETVTPVETAAPGSVADRPDSLVTCDARDGLTVLDTNCIMTTEDYSSFIDCYVYAVVRNDGSSNVALEGEIVVTDAQGSTLDVQSYIMANPSVLAPGDTAVIGEYLLVSKTDSVTLPEQVAGVALTVYADPYPFRTEAPDRIAVTAEVAQSVDNYGMTVDVVRFTLTNDTADGLRNPCAAAALYDTEGHLVLTVDTNTGYDVVILPAGGTLIIEAELPGDLADYLAQTGCTLGAVEALAYGN